MAKGTTEIYNAVFRNHIQQLCRMLNLICKISGVGSNLLIIEGVKYLGGMSTLFYLRYD
jgi:UDP-N-acetylglucosamine 1-carboxyvinyltransferase